MQSIQEKQKEIIAEFSEFEDWQERFQYLIELGDDLPPYPEQYRQKEKLVPGCQSRVWIHSDFQDGKIIFLADSDTALTKGLIAILVHVFSNHTPAEISSASFEFLETIGLQKFLSISRRNGLHSMIQILQKKARSPQ